MGSSRMPPWSALGAHPGTVPAASPPGSRTGASTQHHTPTREPTRSCAGPTDQPWARVKTAEVTPALVSGLAGRRRAPGRSGGWAAASREEGTGGPDLVVLDPPRAGAGLGVTRALAALRPRAVAYVACEPASFARDLKVLLDAGWTMPSLRAFDLFPMTEHVELVALLRPPPAVGTDP